MGDTMKGNNVSNIIEKYRGNKDALISILQDIQAEHNWLPKEIIAEVSEKLNIPLIDIYGVTTFFKAFRLKPRGKYLITVCLGTACHVRGAPRILREFEKKLHINIDETTPDNMFTLETVQCLGCCAIGPIVVVNGEYHGGVTLSKVDSLVEYYRSK